MSANPPDGLFSTAFTNPGGASYNVNPGSGARTQGLASHSSTLAARSLAQRPMSYVRGSSTITVNASGSEFLVTWRRAWGSGFAPVSLRKFSSGSRSRLSASVR